ncbi:phosphonatase-like hydrolase [Microterricola gilva]|uniref:Phosphonatase-like hydrolase n=1 Tax=Microterricola gilva TaxID=393267 RepID=A0A4Q8AJC1_9MICO|nr:phosphonatase-like hydrolase [Microterricola gilva]RZU63869.1 phosphonatase-like hydrolase [Microterricola gilva]
MTDTTPATADITDTTDVEIELDDALDSFYDDEELDEFELEEFELEEYEVAIELVVLDMAGTTVADDGTVERAFGRVAERQNIGATPEEREAALEYVRVTMGQSKIEVFRAITGDEERAQAANAAFEAAYAEIVAEEGVTEIPGARLAIEQLQEAGITVALTTGFARPTVNAILDALDWQELADIVLTPADAGRGRPHPDMPLTALLRTETSAVEAMIVVGDTVSDMQSGTRAGAGLVIGVLSGAHGEEQLLAAGADDVISSVAELPELLGLFDDEDADDDEDDAELDDADGDDEPDADADAGSAVPAPDVQA